MFLINLPIKVVWWILYVLSFEAFFLQIFWNLKSLTSPSNEYAIRFWKFLKFKVIDPIWRTENPKIDLVTWNLLLRSFYCWWWMK